MKQQLKTKVDELLRFGQDNGWKPEGDIIEPTGNGIVDGVIGYIYRDDEGSELLAFLNIFNLDFCRAIFGDYKEEQRPESEKKKVINQGWKFHIQHAVIRLSDEALVDYFLKHRQGTK